MQRLQLARNIARHHMEQATASYKYHFDKHALHRPFYKSQPILLDEHSFLGKNAKLAPKYSGPHVVTRLIGSNNVELLLDNGKRLVVHVNRIKPFRSLTSSLPGDIRFQNRGGVVQHTDHEEDKNEQDIHDATRTQTEQQRSQGVGQQSQRLTRSVTKREGMVYNDQLKQFLENKTLLNIEGIRPKRKPPLKRRTQVKYIPYIEVQDFVDITQPDIDVKEEFKDEYKEEYKEEDIDKLEQEQEYDRSIADDSWENSLGYPEETPLPPSLQRTKRVAFNPVPDYLILPEGEQWHNPDLEYLRRNKDHIYSFPTDRDSQHKGLLRETIDGTARFLFGDITGDSDVETPDLEDPPTTEDRGYGETGSRIVEWRKHSASRQGEDQGRHPDTQPGTDATGRSGPFGQGPPKMESPDRGHAKDCHRVTGHGEERYGGGVPGQGGGRGQLAAGGENNDRTQSEKRPEKENAEATTREAEVTEVSPGTQYSRMATRGNPDWIRQPYQISHWFAKGEGFNEPAELRVLASRYLTDVAEIGHRLEGKPPDPAVLNELERRRLFLVRELRRTGTRYPGFHV